METRHLQIFVAVYKSRSFTKAAEDLYTSQPTISEHMKNLEDRLDCKLFDRLGRSISPTPEADILYPKAVEILGELAKIPQLLASSANTVAGELVIGASTIPGAYVLPEYAAAFKADYPSVSFEIPINDSAMIIDDILEQKIYLGIVGVQIPSAKLAYTPFSGDQLVLAARSDMDMPPQIQTEALMELDFLVREKGSGTGKNVEQFLSDVGISVSELNIRATLGSSTAVKEAIKSGLGVAIISKTAIRDELAQGSLKTIRVEGLSMQRSFYIVTHKKRTLPNSYQAFFNFLTN